jgi:hypothetical protein
LTRGTHLQVERDEIGKSDDTGGQDGKVLQESVGHNGVFGKLGFVETKDGEETSSDDLHGDHRRVAPTSLGQVGERKGQEDQSQRGGDEEETDDVHLVEESNGSLSERFTGSDTTFLGDSIGENDLGLSLSPEHGSDNRSQTDGDQDLYSKRVSLALHMVEQMTELRTHGKHSVPDPPVRQDSLSDLSSDKVVDDERKRQKSARKTTPPQGGHIGDDDLGQKLKTGVSETTS